MSDEEWAQLRASSKPRDVLYAFWHDADLCGCGRPEQALTQLREALEAQASGEGDDWNPLDMAWIDAGSNYLLALALETWGLTEHGHSIYGAWLTDLGRRVLKALQALSPVEFDELAEEL